MANQLTGDFDVVAEFAIPAVNRLIAAMHRVERFPHSMALRVDDNRPPGRDFVTPTLIARVDAFGDPVANQQRIGRPDVVPGIRAASSAVYFNLGPVVNTIGLADIVELPTNLQGRAQLQLFPPSMEVPDASGTNVTIRLGMLARYFPDPNTSPLAEFVRGELRITAPVAQVASQDTVLKVIEIDIKGVNVQIDFVVQWSSRPLSAQDLTAVKQLIRNALKTSFLPSSSPLPAGVAHMQFRTLQGSQNAVAVLLNMKTGPGDRNSATNVFLGGGDDFAFGVGVDFVRSEFQPTLDEIVAAGVPPVSFKLYGVFYTWNITYTIELRSADVELRNGEIVLIIKGRAETGSWTPNFNFTITQKLSLAASGDTANLVVGDVSIDTNSWIIDRFRGRMTSAIVGARDRALANSGAADNVSKMLSASGNLGKFLDSLLQPAQPKSGTPPLPRMFHLSYSSVEISPVGIVLHGWLSVADWPPVHAEFEQIPMDGGGRFDAGHTDVNRGPDYSALKSWIPGGTVQRYEWKSLGQTGTGFIDENRFVLLYQPPGLATFSTAVPLSGYAPMCLTVHGSRLSASGPVVTQPVSASVCLIKSFPVLGVDAVDVNLATFALAQPGPQGLVEVSGHTMARVAEKGRIPPNLIVHFGDRNSGGNLDVLLQGLRESGRVDAPTAVIAILTPEDLRSTRYAEGITYAEDADGAWQRRFNLNVERRPVTAIVTRAGKVAWQKQGEVDPAELAEALRRSLLGGGSVEATMQGPGVRIGQPPPNFLFEFAPGHQVTLRKTAGRPAILVFWRSSSKYSIDMVRELEQSAAENNGRSPMLLAINDGEPPEVARKVAAENKLSATLVTDPARQIALAYGVNTWPTTMWIDELGALRSIRYGRLGGNPAESPFAQTTTERKQERTSD